MKTFGCVATGEPALNSGTTYEDWFGGHDPNWKIVRFSNVDLLLFFEGFFFRLLRK